MGYGEASLRRDQRTQTAVRYQDEILRPTARTYAGTVSSGFLSVHDRRLESVSISWMMDGDWLSHSPDLNPNKHYWEE